MQEIDATMASWQAWVFEALEELHIHRLDLAENLPWEQFFTHFFACLHTSGSYTTLSRLTGIDRPQLYDWMRGTHTPSFATLLEICYICQVTPWQVITNDIEPLVDTLQSGASSQSPRQPRTLGKVDYEACLKKLQDVLEGREEMMSMRQIAKHLGCHTNMIKYHFPKEYTLVVNRAKVHRQQRKEVRIAQVCAEVRQAVHTLHHRGETLSHSKIRALLTDPNVMRMPEAREAWREAKRELGIEVR
jgi:transcriptional regulator with XRE-family HTH domain